MIPLLCIVGPALFGLLIYEIRRAPIGYEDEEGFHVQATREFFPRSAVSSKSLSHGPIGKRVASVLSH